MKKKKTMGAQFMRIFIRTTMCILLCLVLGFASYKISLWYYENIGDAGEVEKSEKLSKYITEIDADGVAEQVSKNLMLAIDEDTGRITRIVIEIVNKETANIDYITVPNNLEFNMSYELYKKLATANGDIPQIIAMNKVHKYFTGENCYQCAQLLLEDLMDISFSYYTVMPDGVCKEMFTKVKATGVLKWSSSYKKEMESLHTQEDYEDFIDKYYEKVTSNLSKSNKMTYIETFLEGIPDQVAFHMVSGERCDNVYVLSVEETNHLINRILNNDAYSEENQMEPEEVTSSVGLSIEILNSTKVNGLASAFQEKLVEQGMNVISIGNYEEQTLENTKILVKKNNYGKDLLSYFNNASIEEGELDSDVDICIILGTSDS